MTDKNTVDECPPRQDSDHVSEEAELLGFHIERFVRDMRADLKNEKAKSLALETKNVNLDRLLTQLLTILMERLPAGQVTPILLAWGASKRPK